MAFQHRTPLLPLLLKCPLLVRAHQASGIFCKHWHHITSTVPNAQTAVRDGRQKCSDRKFLQTRNFYSFFKKSKSFEKIRENDNIESHYELVYSANSTSYIQLGLGGVQATVGFVCLLVGAGVCGFPLAKAAILTEEPLQVSAFIAINFMICLGILRVCTWYPIRIYYSEVEDNFVVVFVGVHPFAVRHLKILPGEVKPSPPGRVAGAVAPWSHHLYSTPTQTIHLNVEHFRYPFYYNKLLGYMRESQ